MTQEERKLLLKDLSARLSYGVICHTDKGDGYLCSINQTIFGTKYGLNISPVKRDYFNDSKQDDVIIKPYLRPMSSMTSEEWVEFCDYLTKDVTSWVMTRGRQKLITVQNREDYFNSKHFDYRGLIEKGLALEAPNDMYKKE